MVEQGEDASQFGQGKGYIIYSYFWRIINGLKNQIANLPSGSGAKTNISTVDPTVNDDSSGGYSVFSLWKNTTTGNVSMCQDASVGAAVWVYIYFR